MDNRADRYYLRFVLSVGVQRWICSNTYVNGRQLRFEGTGFGFFFQWLLIMVLTTITFGIYIPWGYCQFKRWETRNTVFAD